MTVGDLLVGSRVGGYRIEGIVGQGGMGTVYRATQLKLQRIVALKVIAPEAASDVVFRERFKRESLIAASVEHPNVVPIIEADEDGERLYLAMRFVEGTDLGVMIRANGTLPVHLAVGIITQVAAGLGAAHARGLVHRDVKPANVLLTGPQEDPHVYLTDFGIARRVSDEALTVTGAIVGTLAYIAPEQCRGQELDGRADIYALGCVLYQALTGEVPYRRPDPVAQIEAHLNQPVPRPSEARPDLPKALDEVVLRALAKHPDDRYADAAQFAAAAMRALREDESPVAGPRAATPSPSPDRASPGRVLDGDASTGLGQSGSGSDERRPPQPQRRRKIVTALFCDVTGSTALAEKLDPEALVDVMNSYWHELRAVIERHGGTVEKFIGDAVMAVFGVPTVREDDALRAVRAAAEIRDRLPMITETVGVPLQFRTGVNTGLVLVGAGENLAIGDAVNVAARLEQAAKPGDIVIGEATLALVKDAVVVEALEPLELKGKTDRVPAFRLVSVDPTATEGIARHSEVQLVGRNRELEMLRAAWARVVNESACHLFTLVGLPGVGKSRLVAELLDTLDHGATVLRGRCLPYGEAITFWPLIEAFTPISEPAGMVLEHLRSGGLASADELFWETREMLESLAQERPIILHIDDLQWAQPMLFDLLDHVVDLSRGAPILVLASARPELLEERPGWGGGKLNAATVLLEHLSTADCELFLDALGDGLDRDARARVITASEGNPLFIEEMVALARETGTFTVPSTIQALLAARLERLASEERDVLERGAIEGEVFHAGAVAALTLETDKADLRPWLAGLLRKEMVRPHAPQLRGDQAFRFRHLLIRDAAYDGLPKATRAALHERFADWLLANGGELAELDEIVGWHLQQHLRYQHELGRATDPTIPIRAAQHLQNAGRRAMKRNDRVAAINLFERAYSLAPESSALSAAVAVDLAEPLILAYELARVDELLSHAERDPEASVPAALIRLGWRMLTQTDGASEAIESTLPRIIDQLADAGDERGLAKAYLVADTAHMLAGRMTLAAHDSLLAAKHARRAGDEGLRAAALGAYIQALLWGPADAKTIAEKLNEVEQDSPGPSLANVILFGHFLLARFTGNFAEARLLAQRNIDDYRSRGSRQAVAACQAELAEVESLAGNHTSALALLLEADAAYGAAGANRSSTQALLARTYERLGHPDDARTAIDLCEVFGGAMDVQNFSITHAVRARLALAEGDTDAAERWARSAVEHISDTDQIIEAANAQLELAGILAALERKPEAREEATRALELYQAKGDQAGAARAQALPDDLGRET